MSWSSENISYSIRAYIFQEARRVLLAPPPLFKPRESMRQRRFSSTRINGQQYARIYCSRCSDMAIVPQSDYETEAADFRALGWKLAPRMKLGDLCLRCVESAKKHQTMPLA